MSSNPKPSLFDEGLARKVELLFAVIGCGMALAIDLAHHLVGEPVRFLLMFERAAFGLLAVVMVWRYRRHPVLAAVLSLATLSLTAKVAWFADRIPPELLLAIHGAVVAGLVGRSSLPKALRLPIALTALVLGGLSTLTPDFEFWALILWSLAALGVRPSLVPSSGAPIARWRGGTGRWWFFLRVALVLGAVPFAFWTFFRFIPDALSWAPVASLALLFVVSIELLARVAMFRFIEGIGRSTFWTGLRLMQFMALAICAISAGLQLYALVAGLDRWLPYLLGGTSLLIVSLPWCDGAIAVLVLSSSRASPGADRARRRAVWAILLLIEKVVSTILYAVMLTFDLGEGGLELAALIFTAALAGQVCLWGLFASVHRDIVEASMADTFSYDPETPEPRRV